MKKIFKYQIVTIFTIIMLTFAPFTAFAAHMWSETPDLKDDHENVSIDTRSTTFKNGFPVIDKWVETPDLSEENADTGGIIFVHKGGDTIHLNPEMYNETPDLSSIIQ